MALLMTLLISSMLVVTPARAAALPAPWASQDVGNTGAAGSASYDNGVFTLSGAGDAIGGGYDQFHFVYQPLSGDGQIIARVTGIQSGAAGTEAGVIIRETRSDWPPAREALMRLNQAGQLAFEHRAQPQTNATTTAGATVAAPYWVKLVRKGNLFEGYASPDGAAWTLVGSATISMGRDVSMGLAAGGQTFGVLATSTFDNVSTLSGVPSPWLNKDIGNTGAAGSALFSNGVFTVTGAGDEVGGSYDQFHYVYQPLSGDGQIIARIASINGGSDTGVKAAVVIRETLSDWPPAREAIVGLRSGGGSFFAARTEPQTNANLTEGPNNATPYWVKLVRRGNTFTGSVSADGAAWTQVGSATITMAQDVYIGLAGGGQTFGVSATSTFERVTATQIGAGPINVSVDWNNVRGQRTNLSYGMNGFQAFNPANAASAAYNANLTYMNPGAFRYHSMEMMGNSKTSANGWIDIDNRRWDAEKIDAALRGLTYAGAVPMINIPTWPSWMDANGDQFLDADQIDAFAAWCAELVRIVNIQYGHGVVYWEPTNERDDVYYVPFANQGQPDRLDELIDIYNRAAQAMKAVDPSIKVGGPAFARADLYPQVERFVAATINEGTLDFLSMHGYASGDKNESDERIYNRVYNAADPSVNSLTKHTADVRAILDRISPNRRIPLWFNEYNISWTFTNNDPRMQNHKGAVFDALALVYLTDNGADATAAWNEKDGIYGKTDGGDTLRPAAHVFNLMNTYMRGDRVATTTSDATAVVVSAVKNDAAKTRAFLVINRSNAQQQVVANFNGWTPKFSTLSRFEISAAGLSSGGSIEWSLLSVGEFYVPAHSVTLIVAGEGPVRPVLECVAPNSDGSYTAHFGYQNDSGVAVNVPIGAKNTFHPNPQDRGQPTAFQPGRQRRVFSVTFDGSPLVWALDGRTATASDNPRQACR
jgi:xylan 1,4-beta-xylosidase